MLRDHGGALWRALEYRTGFKDLVAVVFIMVGIWNRLVAHPRYSIPLELHLRAASMVNLCDAALLPCERFLQQGGFFVIDQFGHVVVFIFPDGSARAGQHLLLGLAHQYVLTLTVPYFAVIGAGEKQEHGTYE